MDRVHEANLRAKRSRLTTVVYFVDLDRFKLINDHHGHHVGDELLIAVARRFSNMLRADDTVAQISGDEFVFLCENLPDPAEADTIGARIDEAFERPFVVDGLRLSMSANIGMAVAGPGEEVSAELIMHADTGTRRRTDARTDHFRRNNTALFAQRSELKKKLALLTDDHRHHRHTATWRHVVKFAFCGAGSTASQRRSFRPTWVSFVRTPAALAEPHRPMSAPTSSRPVSSD